MLVAKKKKVAAIVKPASLQTSQTAMCVEEKGDPGSPADHHVRTHAPSP